MKTTLVLGVDGQDGSYLAQELLGRGDRVFGIGRRAAPRYPQVSEAFQYLSVDVADANALASALEAAVPDEIYHLAVMHGAAGFAYETIWHDALLLNTGSVHTCLEYLRKASRGRLFYASSLKAFGTPAPKQIDETTPRKSGCLYSTTKNASADLISHYRRTFGVEAAIGYLFNHESPRRNMSFFMPKLVRQLACALDPTLKTSGSTDDFALGTLNFECDWGSSPEFMELAVDVLRTPEPEDAIFATGRPWSGWALAEALSKAAGLSTADWVKVKSPRDDNIPSAPMAQPTRLRELCARGPNQDGLDVALWMLRETYGIDLELPN